MYMYFTRTQIKKRKKSKMANKILLLVYSHTWKVDPYSAKYNKNSAEQQSDIFSVCLFVNVADRILLNACFQPAGINK